MPYLCLPRSKDAQKKKKEALTMAASAELRMDQLPSDPLLHILSFLGFRDVIKYVADTANCTLPEHGTHAASKQRLFVIKRK